MGSRRGDPVVPRLPEPPQSENDFGDQVRGYRLGVSWPRRLVSQSIERHGVAATRSTMQGLNYPEGIMNTMFVELGAMDEPPKAENEGSDIGEIQGYRLGVSWPRKQVIRSIERHGIGTTRTTLQGLNCKALTATPCLSLRKDLLEQRQRKRVLRKWLNLKKKPSWLRQR